MNTENKNAEVQPGDIIFTCSNCNTGLKAPQDMAGKEAKWPNCDNAIAVPEKSES